MATTYEEGTAPGISRYSELLDDRSASARSMSSHVVGKKTLAGTVLSTLPRPVIRTTSSLSRWVDVPEVLLPVIANTLTPSDAMPPAGQMPSPFPAVAQEPVFVASLVSMAVTQPWYAPQSP